MFSKRLREIRIEKGYTQEEIADYLGFTRPTYTAYESGRRKPDNDTLAKIARFLNVSTDYLLCISDIKHPIETIAAHHDSEEWTEEELAEIERFKEFVRMKRQQRKKNE